MKQKDQIHSLCFYTVEFINSFLLGWLVRMLSILVFLDRRLISKVEFRVAFDKQSHGNVHSEQVDLTKSRLRDVTQKIFVACLLFTSARFR